MNDNKQLIYDLHRQSIFDSDSSLLIIVGLIMGTAGKVINDPFIISTGALFLILAIFITRQFSKNEKIIREKYGLEKCGYKKEVSKK